MIAAISSVGRLRTVSPGNHVSEASVRRGWAVRSFEIARCLAAALSRQFPLHSAFPRGRREGRKAWVGRARLSLHFPRSRRSANRHARIPRESRAFGWPSWQDISSLDLDRSAGTEERLLGGRTVAPYPPGSILFRSFFDPFSCPRRALSARLLNPYSASNHACSLIVS